MLAYIFWHRPYLEMERAAFERDLRDFHRALASAHPPGWLESWAFRLRSLPWLAGGGPGYEDWYLVEDFGALGPLNGQAVAGVCQEPHNRVARVTEIGAGGLYRLHHGEPAVGQARYAVWLVKARATPYETFYQRLAPLTDGPGLSLWRRQLVLGPAPEFCLLAPEPPSLPDDLDAVMIERVRIAP